jgi:integrase/recombinase XerD
MKLYRITGGDMGNKEIAILKSSPLTRTKKFDKSKLDFEFFNNFESPHTRKSYKNDISGFYKFISECFPEIREPKALERVHIVAFKTYLTEKGLAPKTINRKLSANSSYFDFLVEKGIMDNNPSTCIKRPRQEVKNPTNDLSDEQISALFKTIDPKSPSGPLHKAVIYLLFATGIRKSELINLKLKEWKNVNGYDVIEVRAKGGKFLMKALHPECVEVLKDYLRWMDSLGRRVEPDHWVFQPTKNPTNPKNLMRPLSTTTVDYIVQTYCKKAGITQRVSPHSARASYIGSALESGEDIFKVSQDVGHSSVRTTEGYNKRRRQIKDSPAYNLNFLKKSA